MTWQRTVAYQGKRLTEKEYKRAKEHVGMRALAALPKDWPTDKAYALEVLGFWPDRRFGDSDRLVSLVMDALEGIAYKYDRQVRVQTSSVLLDRSEPRTEVLLVPYDEDKVVPVVTIDLTRLSTTTALR